MSLAVIFHQFSEILHCGNKQILDCLLPESTPPGPFETVTVSRVGKAAFAQVLPSFEILSGCFGVSDFARSIQQLLISMSVDGATTARACTEGAQLTHQAGSFGGHVFPTQALRV